MSNILHHYGKHTKKQPPAKYLEGTLRYNYKLQLEGVSGDAEI